MLRKIPLVTGSIFHIYNRGVNKGPIFFSEEDCRNFLDIAVYYKTNTAKLSDQRTIKRTLVTTDGDTGSPSTGSGAKPDQTKDLIIRKPAEEPRVKILAYCLMPNHFHFIIKQLVDGGITTYMRHFINSYVHHINLKNERVGPLFQGRFKNVPVENDEQLMHLSRYIHLNPLVDNLVVDLRDYTLSSYLNYLGEQEDKLVEPEEVIGYFKTRTDYEKFVLDQANYAKELANIKHLTFDLE